MKEKLLWKWFVVKWGSSVWNRFFLAEFVVWLLQRNFDLGCYVNWESCYARCSKAVRLRDDLKPYGEGRELSLGDNELRKKAPPTNTISSY